MSPEEAQPNAPRRRGRPPGSKNRPTGKRAECGELVTRLNSMVARLISENRSLRRQVARLSTKGKATTSNKTVERGLRTISRRVERALGAKATGRRKPSANGRRRKTATRRKRTS